MQKSGTAPASPYEGRLHRVPVRKSRALPVFGGLAVVLMLLLMLGQFLNSSLWTRVQAWPDQVAQAWSKPASAPDSPQSRDVPPTAQAPVASTPAETPRQMSCVSSSGPFAGGPEAAVQSYAGVLEGALGKALALAMLLMGGAIAVVRNNPMSAITGVMGAGFISFGPRVIMAVLGCA